MIERVLVEEVQQALENVRATFGIKTENSVEEQQEKYQK